MRFTVSRPKKKTSTILNLVTNQDEDVSLETIMFQDNQSDMHMDHNELEDDNDYDESCTKDERLIRYNCCTDLV